MASERQIAANRRNARKSTGPRSGAGRKRASHNAYRHGLNLNMTSTAAFAKQLDKLVRQIIRFFNAVDRGQVTSFPERVDSSAPMPPQEPYRSAEAIRRVLPELRK